MAKKSALIGEQKSVWQRMKESKEAYLYITPAIVVVILVSFIPIVYGIYISFTNMNLFHVDDYKFVWFQNYIDAFGGVDAQFVTVLGRTLLWTVINIFFHVGIGISLALALNRKSINNIYRKITRSLLILPWAVPNLITLMIWKYMYNYQFGFINAVLKVIHIKPIMWLEQASGFWPFVAVCVANIWLGFPFMMMVATGGLQAISEDIYEAGEIDGASSWQMTTKLTLPLLKPVMVPAIILGTIWTFTNFNAVYMITGGGPTGKTDVLATYQFTALNNFQYNQAATYAVVTSLILMFITFINMKVNKALDEEAVQ